MPQLITVLTEDKMKQRLYFAAYRARHRERIAKRDREYQAVNAEARKAYRRAYYLANRGLIARKMKEEKPWLLPHNRQRAAEYVAANTEKIRSRRRKWWAQRFYSDTEFRLLHNMRNRLNGAMNRQCKVGRTIELIGCTAPELKSHIERLFLDGMSWDNYGAWHVDHIRPCASFDLTQPEQQRACFHYTNLRPLWAVDNIVKAAKVA